VKTIFEHAQEKPDVILLKNGSEPFIDENFFYVTGLTTGLFEGSVALLLPDGAVTLLVSELEAETAQTSPADVKVYSTTDQFHALLQKLLASHHRIGFNSQGLTQHDFQSLTKRLDHASFLDVSEAITAARVIKDQEELARIRHACHIADDVMSTIPELLDGTMTEDEIAAEINYLLQKKQADKPAFDTIASFGANSSQPHYTHGSRRLQKGDLALFDFGAQFHKYNSDMTRTFFYNKPEDLKRDMYHVVAEAQQKGFDAICEGVKASTVHETVQSFIDQTPFKGRFIHSTGHGLGLSVHDPGVRFSKDCMVELKENMVLTVEPGVYLPGVGGVRIEDDIRVTKNGVELLTKTSRELLIV
jgi:Xaa-Pro dipeptidase